MSLVRLLAAGKSLVGLRDGASPYRVTQQRLLPEFGRRNPFRDTARLPSEPSVGSPAAETVSRLAAKVIEPEAGSLPAGAGLAEPAPPAVAALETSPPASGPSRLRQFLGGLFVARRSRAVRATSRPMCQPVQGELSLDRVRVVRNDLRDADLEVVPRQAVQAEGAHKRSENVPVGASRMPLRLFGAAKS